MSKFLFKKEIIFQYQLQVFELHAKLNVLWNVTILSFKKKIDLALLFVDTGSLPVIKATSL